MSIGFFTRNRPGVLISRITNDVDALDQLISTGVVTLFSSTLTLVGVVVIMLVADVQLALVVFLTLPLLAIASLVFRIVAASAYRITRERIAEVTAYLQESLSGVRVVRSFAQEQPPHRAEWRELNELNRQANLKTVYLNASYFPAVELLSAIGTAVILLYGGYQALDLATESARNAQIGIVVAFVGYLSTFFDPIQQLSNLYTTYQQGMAALDKIFDLLDTEPDMVDKPDALDPGTLRGEIEMDGVWFSYGLDKTAGLKRSSGKIETGPTTRRTMRPGRSRTSRSTSRPARPWRWSGRRAPGSRPSRSWSRASTTRSVGTVLVDGNDLRDLSSTCLRSQLGIVPQEGFLFSGTVRENIAFGRPDASDEEIEAAADAIGAGDFIRRHADWLRHRGRRARRVPLRGPAAADRLRPGAAGRAADPDPGRGDLQRRRADRAHDRARARAAARGPDRDRDRAPALDHPQRGADRGAGERPDRRERHARRADRGRRPLRRALRDLGRSWPRRSRARLTRADAAGAA